MKQFLNVLEEVEVVEESLALDIEEVTKVIDAANPEIINYSRNILYNFGYERALKPLRYILQDVTKPMSYRSWSAGALGQLGDFESENTLIAIASDKSEDYFLRRSALWGLGELKTSKGLELLKSILATEDSPELILFTLEAISLYSADLVFPPVVDFVQKKNIPLELFYKAIEILKEKNPNELYKLVTLMLENPQDLEEDKKTILTLNLVFSPNTSESDKLLFFRDFASNVGLEKEIRMLALVCLTEARDYASVPLFIELLYDTDEDIVTTAISMLGRFSDPSAIPALTPLTNHENVTIRECALNSIETILKSPN